MPSHVKTLNFNANFYSHYYNKNTYVINGDESIKIDRFRGKGKGLEKKIFGRCVDYWQMD